MLKRGFAALFCILLLSQSALAVSFTDAAGRDVEVENPQRVISLFGSYGEIWRQAGGELLATTQDILERRPDDVVQSIGSYSNPSMETLFALEPDWVILSGTTKSHFDIAAVLEEVGVPYAFFDVLSWDEYMVALDVMTQITGRRDLYEAQVETVQKPIEMATTRAQAWDGFGKTTALLLRASSTKVHAKGSDDTVAGRILRDMGFVNLADGDSVLAENLSMEAILLADPDWIFVTTMGMDGEAAMATVRAALLDNPAWSTLTAVREGRYVVLDPMLFHYRPNERWAEAYEQIKSLINGKVDNEAE
ncbi:MAG: ABC transporter substrate-binding protein [Clostridia bacterium]|nr:ABC transporter substrate-binding protein [Clostridia bacterium]